MSIVRRLSPKLFLLLVLLMSQAEAAEYTATFNEISNGFHDPGTKETSNQAGFYVPHGMLFFGQATDAIIKSQTLAPDVCPGSRMLKKSAALGIYFVKPGTPSYFGIATENRREVSHVSFDVIQAGWVGDGSTNKVSFIATSIAGEFQTFHFEFPKKQSAPDEYVCYRERVTIEYPHMWFFTLDGGGLTAIDNVTYEETSQSDPKQILGAWRGIQTCLDKSSGIDLSIYRNGPDVWTLPSQDDPIAAMVTFYPLKGSKGPVGTFMASVEQQGDRSFTFKAEKWISQPSGSAMFNLKGSADAKLEMLTGQALSSGCSSFSVSRIAPDAASLPTCATLANRVSFMEGKVNLLKNEEESLKLEFVRRHLQNHGDPLKCTADVLSAIFRTMAEQEIFSTITGKFSTKAIQLERKISKAESEDLAELIGKLGDVAGPSEAIKNGFKAFSECKIAKNPKERNVYSEYFSDIYAQTAAWRASIYETQGKIARMCP